MRASPILAVPVVGVVALLACVAAPQALAQAQPKGLVDPTAEGLDYAFSSHLGSGIYTVDGRTIQIYRIPVKWDVFDETEHPWGLELSIPVTFGFFDFNAADVLELDLPSQVGTASILPGARFILPQTTHWTMSPFVELGAAKDFEGGSWAWVWGVGLENEWHFQASRAGGLDWRASNQVLWAGSRTPGNREQHYLEFRTGVEGHTAFGKPSAKTGRRADVSLYAVSYLYPQAFIPGVLKDREGLLDATAQWELGYTFGATPKLKILKIPLPRLGLGFRFGEGAAALRLVFGIPF